MPPIFRENQCHFPLVRPSTMVIRIPSIFSFGLICRRTLLMVRISRFRPFVERKSGADGMITLSAAARALMDIRPKDGIQSMRM